MPKFFRAVLPVFIIGGVLGAAVLLAWGLPRGRSLGSRTAEAGWPAEDIFLTDLADAPAMTAVQKDALFRALRAAVSRPASKAVLRIDYPFANALFPPDMIGPTFLFHDDAAASGLWLVVVSPAGEKGRLFVLTDGRRPKAEIDPRCVAANNVYREPEYQASARGWTASEDVWRRVAALPEKDIAVAVHGLADFDGSKIPAPLELLSRGAVVIRISEDPVGAPIFYRDVPLMPAVNEQGVVKPLQDDLLPVIEWRLRDLRKPVGRVVLTKMPTCGNCHSFSNDGKYLGMDMDGPSGDKGSYAIAPITPRMAIGKDQVFTWNSFNPQGETFGLFSRVSPDGRYVVSAVNEKVFVSNYTDFRFLQTFYPTRGILAVYDRATKKIAALPGADDPAYIQGNAVWTPDGRTIVFIRAKAADNIPKGSRPVKANDPNEIQIKYDLASLPFKGGRGGEARLLPGASANGKSNSFPKVSPDGRWIVWVQAANGLLMRPDSELYIMPLSGGTPRRMACNLPLMNSWHSWSPNGRWLVFSSKGNGPFTQMFLTHVDDRGFDSPAILIPHSTAVNRAVNIPEFVAIPPDGLLSMDVPAVDYRRHLDLGIELIKARDLPKAFAELRTAEEMKPNFAETLAALGYYYRETGDLARAIGFFEKALAVDPRNWAAHNYYGVTMLREGRHDEALGHFQAAVDIYPLNFQALTNMGVVFLARNDPAGAREYFVRAIEANPQYAQAHYNLASVEARAGKFREAVDQYEKGLQISPDDADTLGNLSWLLATSPDDAARDGRRALDLAQRFQRLAPAGSPRPFDILAAAYAETGRFPQAVESAGKALSLTAADDPAAGLRRRLVDLYKSGTPYHQQKL